MKKALFLVLILSSTLALPFVQVRAPCGEGKAPFGRPPVEGSGELTPAQEYAGEILSYLLQVVLGREGDPRNREEWATRGLEARLDFQDIWEVMTDPEKSEIPLLVMDPNILELANVLYYYDERLSLHKDDSAVASLFPAPEFVAIRLLLLKKIHQGEKMNLEAIINRKALLFSPHRHASQNELRAMNLSMDELKILRAVLEKEPHIYGYLNCPFLIHALFKMGAIKMDPYVRQQVERAHYKPYPCRPVRDSNPKEDVTIAILPSMTRAFYYGEGLADSSPYGFSPRRSFRETTEKLQKDIRNALKDVIMKATPGETAAGWAGIRESEWELVLNGVVQERVSFRIQDQRPLVIYPANAEKVIRDVCPEADFSIILLDKGVYLSLNLEEGKMMYPHLPWFYIDSPDVKHSRVNEEMDMLGAFIYERLRPHLKRLMGRIRSYDSGP